jgi:hypothetical protein
MGRYLALRAASECLRCKDSRATKTQSELANAISNSLPPLTATSTFSSLAQRSLALSPIRDTLIEGFSHFVTFMTAPIASGWSGCRVGLHPLAECSGIRHRQEKKRECSVSSHFFTTIGQRMIQRKKRCAVPTHSEKHLQ